MWWLFQWGELFDKNKLRAVAVSSPEKSPWFPCAQLDVFRFTRTELLWHGHWRWNRPASAHKHSTTLPALCTAGWDDTRGTGLYWVLLRLLCKSGRCSGKAQPAGQQRRASRWNAGRLANAEGLCRPACCVWMSWDETWPPFSSFLIKLCELSAEKQQQIKIRAPSFNPEVLFGVLETLINSSKTYLTLFYELGMNFDNLCKNCFQTRFWTDDMLQKSATENDESLRFEVQQTTAVKKSGAAVFWNKCWHMAL